MKIFSLLLLMMMCTNSKNETGMKSNESFYNLSAKEINGEEVNFSDFKGKKVLIVNVASKCGYTPQYSELEELHKKYQDKLVILGFPSNEFMKQEPGTNEEIIEFCQKNYGVTFQIFEKTEVKSKDKHAVYQWLTDKSKNGWNDEAPKWNFHKYLIDESGELIGVFPSGTKPMSKEITSNLE
jgi:glutathione peroxidase